MKTYEFIFDCDKESAISQIMAGVQKTCCFMEDEIIYGKVSKNSILLYKGFGYRNNIKLVFVADVLEENGKTILKGRWRLPVYLRIFISVFVAISVLISLLPTIFSRGTANLPLLYLSSAIVLVFALVIFGIGVKLGEKGRKDVIKHLDKCKKSFETEK